MSDQSNSTQATTETTPTRIFKIGSVRITEDESMRGKSNLEIQKLLAPLYPQVENASISEQTEGDVTSVSFLPKPGRKG